MRGWPSYCYPLVAADPPTWVLWSGVTQAYLVLVGRSVLQDECFPGCLILIIKYILWQTDTLMLTNRKIWCLSFVFFLLFLLFFTPLSPDSVSLHTFKNKNNKIKINWLTRGAYRDFIELLLGKKMCLAQEIIQSMTLLAKAAEQDRAFKKNLTRVLNPIQLLSFIHTTNTATVNYSHSISIPLPWTFFRPLCTSF